MFDCPIYHHFGFYGPDTHKEPTPEIISCLLKAFEVKGFIPTTVQELVGVATDTLHLGTRLQLQFTSPDQEWNLAFENNRLLLKKAIADNTQIGSANDFCKEAEEIFRLLLEAIQFNADRFSFVTKGFLPAMSPQVLTDTHNRIFNCIPFYEENPPGDWTTRNVTRVGVNIGEKSESLNVITTINRVQGTMQGDVEQEPFDRIQIAFDINTYQEDKETRFGVDDISLFLDIAIKKSERILEEIERKINE